MHAGPLDEGEQAVAPLRALAPPVADFVRADAVRRDVHDGGAGGAAARGGEYVLLRLARRADAARELLDRMQASTALLAAAQIRVLGGAVSRVPSEATAYAHRQRRMIVNVAAIYASPDEDPVHRAWVDDAAAALRHGDDGRTSTSSETRAPSASVPRIPVDLGSSRRGQAQL